MGGLRARLKKVVAFLGDPRVPKLPRLAVVMAVAYLLWPVDLLPDLLIPVGGLMDDAALLWTTLRWLLKSGDSATAISPGGSGAPGAGPPR